MEGDIINPIRYLYGLVRLMDSTDRKILKAINKESSKYFVSPIKVNEVLKLDINELGERLMLLKKSGHVDIITAGDRSSLTLPNSISKVSIADLGRSALKEKK